MEGTETGKRRQVRDPVRTRRVIVEALLAALDEGELAPTARGLADRAGVSERSIFVHFPDLDELRLAAAEHQLDQVAALLEPVPAERSLPARVDRLLAQHERVFPLQVRIHRASLTPGRTSMALESRVQAAERSFRQHLAAVFAAELGDDDQLLALLEPVVGWPVRQHLVQRRGFTNRQASRAIRRAALALLEQPGR